MQNTASNKFSTLHESFLLAVIWEEHVLRTINTCLCFVLLYMHFIGEATYPREVKESSESGRSRIQTTSVEFQSSQTSTGL